MGTSATPARPASAHMNLKVSAAALPDDPDSQTVLGWICAHLSEVELMTGPGLGREPGGQSDREPGRENGGVGRTAAPRAGVAVVCDDSALAERAERAGRAVVFVSSTGSPPVHGWPPARVRCLHRPGWLPYVRLPGVQRAGTVAPPRAARARRGQGVLIRMAVPSDGQAPEVPRLLGSVRDLLADASAGPVFAVHLHGPGSATAAAAVTAEVPHATVFRDQDSAAERALTDASLLLSSPALTGVTLAQTAQIPLAVLPPLGPRQRQAASVLGSGRPPVTVLSGDPACAADEAAALRRALRTPRKLAQWAEAGQRDADDDRRGAQRIARRVRQLLLAPM